MIALYQKSEHSNVQPTTQDNPTEHKFFNLKLRLGNTVDENKTWREQNNPICDKQIITIRYTEK